MRAAPFLLVGVIPALMLSIGVAHFVLNHFFSRAPYLLDSGWCSAIVYRAGLLPHNPAIACDYGNMYYGIHVSPFTSALSILSYLTPLDRIEWYSLVEAIVYFPIGIATYALASQLAPEGAMRRLPITILAALAFGFSGLVLKSVGYPHYEVAIAGLVCLLLVAVVAGRSRTAWVLLILAVSVREDAGMHAGLALAPLLYLKWRGVEIPTSLRTIRRMMVAAACASVLGLLLQSLFFQAADLLTIEYLGSPLYGHLSASVLDDRLWIFLKSSQFIYYPFLATLVVALVRRDARYLLGWAATALWFALNFAAAQEAKSRFDGYTGFPFLISTFWVFLYGAKLAPPARRLRPGAIAAVFAAVCLTSTLGFYQGAPVAFRFTLHDMAVSRHRDRSAVHGFVAAMEARGDRLGKLYVDDAVAALALESLGPDELWHPGVTGAKAIAFHRDTWGVGVRILPDLIVNELDVCTHVVGTGIFVCTRERVPASMFAGLATEVLPAAFVFARRGELRIDDRALILRGGISFTGMVGRLPRGRYELRCELDAGSGTPSLQIQSDEVPRRVSTFAGDHEVRFDFDASGAESLAFRLTAGPHSVAITGAQLRRLSSETAARP